MAGKVIDSKGKPITIVLLGGHIVKLHFTYCVKQSKTKDDMDFESKIVSVVQTLQVYFKLLVKMERKIFEV